jgi:hypothetical protein
MMELPKNYLVPDLETLWAYSYCIQGAYHAVNTDQGVLVNCEIRPNDMKTWLEVAREVP